MTILFAGQEFLAKAVGFFPNAAPMNAERSKPIRSKLKES
jgi:hypothetical protein